jgi:hypothetical protein
MGDRTYVSVTVSQKDLERAIDEIGAENQSDNGDGTCTLGIGDVHPDDQVDPLIAAGIVFVGYHESGMGYGPHVFAFDGEEDIDIPCDSDCNNPVAGIQEDGTPEEGHVESAMVYWKVYRNAMNLMSIRKGG